MVDRRCRHTVDASLVEHQLGDRLEQVVDRVLVGDELGDLGRECKSFGALAGLVAHDDAPPAGGEVICDDGHQRRV